MRHFKNGDKVVILSKSYWGPLKNSNVWNRGKKQGYWYFQKYERDYKELCVVDDKFNTNTGDYFYEKDLEFYKNKKLMKLFESEDFEL